MICLTENELKEVRKILNDNLESGIVRVFGSRITNRVKPYSDLDLCIERLDQTPFHWQVIPKIKEHFEESTLVFRVDIIDYFEIDDNFKKIIDKNSVEILRKE